MPIKSQGKILTWVFWNTFSGHCIFAASTESQKKSYTTEHRQNQIYSCKHEHQKTKRRQNNIKRKKSPAQKSVPTLTAIGTSHWYSKKHIELKLDLKKEEFYNYRL